MKTLKSPFTSLWLCLTCQHRISCCLMKYTSTVFRRCDWLFPLSAREVSPENRSNYKSTREKVDFKGSYGRWRLHLMGFCLNITLLSKEITLSKSAKNLGVTMDCNLTYDEHVTQLTSKCIRSLCQINRVKYLFDRRTLITIINSLVFSKLLYCSSVWANTTK